ncbi:MAG: tetratricopeptide repeat protein [Chloroflexi bacterium]|nr:tetratricopeptide repeat protein [Chloroflexota bacterium]
MTARQELEQAIAVLETHRDILEDDVVNTAVAALREKLLTVHTKTSVDFQQNTIVLAADLSDFTAMSELMDAEEVRDTINAVWQKLDSVIVAWGGQIDQHVGDGVTALFPIATDLTDCAERATLAALDMQQELTLFNKKHARREVTVLLSYSHSDWDLRMRIGIHAGPVLFGKVGGSSQHTAVGDTVSIANQLEGAAPVGGILISDHIFDHVQHNFITKPAPPLLLDGADRHTPVHVAHREKRHMLQDVEREVIPSETRFVGRTAELERLQLALETTLESGKAQVIVIMGDAGIGKSRLRMEFEKLLALQPIPVRLFKGAAENEIVNVPYAVWHRLMANYFDIDRRSSPQVARAKLVEGICSILSDDDVHARERAHFMGHLLGFDLTDSPYLQNFKHGPQRIREYAFQDMALFFSTITENNPAALFLEDMTLSDEGSLALLDYLTQACAERPLLILCFARPNLATRWPICQFRLSMQDSTHMFFDLTPLSPIDSRHLIASRLQNIPRPPPRLIDLLAEAAEGNPFLIAELIEALGEIGVIIKGSKQWRVQLGQLNDLRGKLTLDWLLEKQSGQLLPLEQTILRKAAVIGNVFGDTVVIELIRADNKAVASRQIRAALHALEQQELIIPQTTSAFPNSREYQFRHESLRRAAYEVQTLPQRQAAHAQYAAWLQEQGKPRPPNFHAVVAAQLEQAGQKIEAADWHGRAANRAKENFLLETAIQYYRQALHLLPATIAHIPQRLRLNNSLGMALRQQARFDKAIAVFTEIHTTALEIGDAATAANAFRNLFIIQNFQGLHRAALRTAERAEQIARDNNSGVDLATALAAKGWAYAYLDDLRQALALGKQALTISVKISAQREMAYSHGLISIIGRMLRRFDEAQTGAEKALALFRAIGDRLWEGVMLNNLGRIAFAQRDYETAVAHLKESLRLAQNNDDYHGAMRNLRDLSKIAQRQGDFETAESRQKQALIWAEKSGNLPFRIAAAADLGRLHLERQALAETAVSQGSHLRQARLWLERGWQLAAESPHMLSRVIVQIEMARLLLAEQTPEKALSQIRNALLAATESDFLQQGVKARIACAVSWRELAVVAIELSPADLPLKIGDQTYHISDCFNQSVQILAKAGDGTQLENAYSLFAWAVYELRLGDHKRGETLWQKAQTIYTQLGIIEEVAKMERFAL